jgi:hypothetical protein
MVAPRRPAVSTDALVSKGKQPLNGGGGEGTGTSRAINSKSGEVWCHPLLIDASRDGGLAGACLPSSNNACKPNSARKYT